MKIFRKFSAGLVLIILVLLLEPALGNHPEISSSNKPKDSRISLQFSQIEMTELLQVLAKMGDTNFLLSESIQGKISVDLKDTPWRNCPPFDSCQQGPTTCPEWGHLLDWSSRRNSKFSKVSTGGCRPTFWGRYTLIGPSPDPN